MAVYVDQFPAGWGRWTGGGHMLASDLSELHSMARRIGLRRAWFQDKRYPHYDLTASKRELALKHGAVPIGLGEIPADVIMRDPDGTYGTRAQLRDQPAGPAVPDAEQLSFDVR